MTIKKNTPLVSVVMATFNEPQDIIKKSIESIINQTYTNFELIIIDDSDIEETQVAIDSFCIDPRVKVIRRNDRIGFVKSLNIGLNQAQGLYIARMDGDDISIVNRLELQVQYLEKNPLVSIVGGSMSIIDENDQILAHKKYPTSGFLLKCWSIYRNPMAHPTIMMRRKCVDEGFVYDDTFNKAEDLEYWLRLRKNGFKLANMPVDLLKYRINGDLSLKRESENWSYNLKARRKNFSLRLPLSSLIGISVSYIYTKLPKSIIRATYLKENSKRG